MYKDMTRRGLLRFCAQEGREKRQDFVLKRKSHFKFKRFSANLQRPIILSTSNLKVTVFCVG